LAQLTRFCLRLTTVGKSQINAKILSKRYVYADAPSGLDKKKEKKKKKKKRKEGERIELQGAQKLIDGRQLDRSS
jgi:hypothetical protein